MRKTVILFIYDILMHHTDEDHPLSRNEIQNILKSKYDISLERHTFSTYMNDLMEEEIDIQVIDDGKTASNKLYFLGERTFEKAEIHLLCNAVYSSHFIPESASKDLIKKLLSTQSKYTSNDFNTNVYLKNNNKSLNKDFFLNIEILIDAIHQKRAVAFDYMKYDFNKQLVPRKDHQYIMHPYHIVYANENYYLLCLKEGFQDISHYRIDKMKNMNITNIPLLPLRKDFSPYEYCKSKIYMYGGEVQRITLRCHTKILDDIIEHFGQDVYIQKVNDESFLAVVKSSKQGMIYFALQYMNFCTVIDPIEIKEEIKTILQDNLEKYKKD